MTRIQELAELIEKHTGSDGAFSTNIPSVSLHRASDVSQPHLGVFDPAVCIVAQGRKRMMFGESIRAYDAQHYLVISLAIPVLTEVVEASPEKPLLCAVFNLDPTAIGALMIESHIEPPKREPPGPAIVVSPLADDLLDTFVRLIRLLGSPHDIPVLAPLLEKELLYRLLRGEQAAQMSQIAFADSNLHRINRAITSIKRNFDQPIGIEALALEVGMSRSGFHKNFQAVTGLSPLQYQKQLRLQEARHLMLSKNIDAATVSHIVGYESPSQFNREYKRVFGSPPHRDIAELKARGESVG
jgi:AraC-like DNA-binding protein